MLRLRWMHNALPVFLAVSLGIAGTRSAAAATMPPFQWEPADEMVAASSAREAPLTLRLRVSDSHYVARDQIRFELAGAPELRIVPGPLPAPRYVAAPNVVEPVAAYSGETLFPVTLLRPAEVGQAAAVVPVRILVTTQAFTPQRLFTKTLHEINLTILFPAAATGAPTTARQDAPATPPGDAPPPRATPGPATPGIEAITPTASTDGAAQPPLPGERSAAPTPTTARSRPARSGWPIHLVFGLLVAALLLDPADVRTCRRPDTVNLPLLIGAALALLIATGTGAVVALVLAAAESGLLPVRAFIWLCVTGCLLPGLGYWVQTPRPPWPPGTAPHPPGVNDIRTLRGSTSVALRLLRHAIRYAWPAILGSWALLAGRGTPPLQFASATAALAVGAFVVWALAALGWSPSAAPRYTTGALAIGYLTAALHLLCLLYPILRPPESFPFAQYLISLILVVIGVIVGAIDRPLHGHGARVTAIKLLGTVCCVAGLFRLTTGLAGPRHYDPDIPPHLATAEDPEAPAPPDPAPASLPAASDRPAGT